MKLPAIKDFKNIAIVQTAFLGDVALTLPLAQAIKNYHPKAQLSFVTTPAASSLVSCAEAVDNVISYDKRGLQTGMRGINLIAETLREKRTDLIIAPHRSLRTSLITYKAKPLYSVGFNRNSLALIYKKRIKYEKRIHELDRDLSLLNAFSDKSEIINNSIKVELDIANDDKSYIDSRLNWAGISGGTQFAAIAPGSVWETKRWKEEHFIELAQKLCAEGIKPVIIGSKQEMELCRRIASKSSALDLSGETTIPQVLYLLQQASVTITNDSAPTHLAGLSDCPTITIYGPTSPIFGFAPRGMNDKIIYNNLKCSPCAIHGGDKCPIKTHECMTGILPAQVFETAIQVIKEIEKSK